VNGALNSAGDPLAPDTFWKGLIDDVRIYDRAVRPEEEVLCSGSGRLSAGGN